MNDPSPFFSEGEKIIVNQKTVNKIRCGYISKINLREKTYKIILYANKHNPLREVLFIPFDNPSKWHYGIKYNVELFKYTPKNRLLYLT